MVRLQRSHRGAVISRELNEVGRQGQQGMSHARRGQAGPVGGAPERLGGWTRVSREVGEVGEEAHCKAGMVYSESNRKSSERQEWKDGMI